MTNCNVWLRRSDWRFAVGLRIQVQPSDAPVPDLSRGMGCCTMPRTAFSFLTRRSLGHDAISASATGRPSKHRTPRVCWNVRKAYRASSWPRSCRWVISTTRSHRVLCTHATRPINADRACIGRRRDEQAARDVRRCDRYADQAQLAPLTRSPKSCERRPVSVFRPSIRPVVIRPATAAAPAVTDSTMRAT